LGKINRVRDFLPLLAFFLVLPGFALAGSRTSVFFIDNSASKVAFRVRSTGHGFEGWAEKIQGRLVLNPNGYGRESKGTIEVPVSSMKTGIGMRDRIMWQKTLKARLYPIVRFELTGLNLPEGLLPEGRNFLIEVTGRLTIHGVTKPITVPILAARTKDGLRIRGAFQYC
jgi:polyisoprenoid-binding protein YceI